MYSASASFTVSRFVRRPPIRTASSRRSSSIARFVGTAHLHYTEPYTLVPSRQVGAPERSSLRHHSPVGRPAPAEPSEELLRRFEHALQPRLVVRRRSEGDD